MKDGQQWTVPFTADSDVEAGVEILGNTPSTSKVTSDFGLINFYNSYNCVEEIKQQILQMNLEPDRMKINL